MRAQIRGEEFLPTHQRRAGSTQTARPKNRRQTPARHHSFTELVKPKIRQSAIRNPKSQIELLDFLKSLDSRRQSERGFANPRTIFCASPNSTRFATISHTKPTAPVIKLNSFRAAAPRRSDSQGAALGHWPTNTRLNRPKPNSKPSPSKSVATGALNNRCPNSNGLLAGSTISRATCTTKITSPRRHPQSATPWSSKKPVEVIPPSSMWF